MSAPDHVALKVDGGEQPTTTTQKPKPSSNSGEFGISPDAIYDLVDPKNPEEYAKLGGIEGMLKALKVDGNKGLITAGSGPSYAQNSLTVEDHKGDASAHGAQPVDRAARVAVYGTNTLPEPISKSLIAFMIDALKDKTLIVLCIAAAVEIAVGIYKLVDKHDSLAIIDGVAIIVAVLIVVLVASINDYRKQAQFRKLNDFSKSLSGIKVIRDGEKIQIPTKELLVGDICTLEVGDVLPADGVLLQGFNVETDESSLTGEPVNIRKDMVKDPFLLSGTKAVSGMGKFLVIATGVNSFNGRTMLALEVEAEETPLQSKLSKLADEIAKFGVGAAGVMIVILLITYFAITKGQRPGDEIAQSLINIFITAITLVVVAVPEGLPLAVTLALAHATIKMLADKNLVRHLSACETMGNATTICSDKTGTLTLNRMTVTSCLIGDHEFHKEDLPGKLKDMYNERKELLQFMTLGVNINSTASEGKNKDGETVFNGSKTEIALLNLTKGLGFPYQPDRDNTKVVDLQPFSSERKRMSAVIELAHNAEFEAKTGITHGPSVTNGKRYWVHVKGASEIVLRICDSYVDEHGTTQPLTDKVRQRYEQLIDSYAKQALRTICAAFKPTAHSGETTERKEGEGMDDEEGLTLYAIFGIQDPVRPEVPGAVKQCMDAGIRVRMVTGDNIATAKAIATECKIYTEGGIVMEGPAFRKLSEEQMDEMLPRLQVLARSSPLDKQILVRALKRLGETVAVTGDGTNDAPALKGSDVGFSMGITGTEVAKEASDIVILDDNFASIVKAVLWGRSVFDSVRKFLQFQLTVNVSAVLITIVTAIDTTASKETGKHIPESALTAVQLLWVNLIMDTLAALALATDPPTPDLLQRKPSRRNERLVNFPMARMIIGQAIYQIVVCLVIYWMAPIWWPVDPSIPKTDEDYYNMDTGKSHSQSTMVFNVFVFCQVFNEINARSITRDLNIFKGIMGNRIFQGVILITIVLQAIIVEFGGPVFKTQGGLNGVQWAVCLIVGLGSLPVGAMIRLLPDWRKNRDEDADPREANKQEIELENVGRAGSGDVHGQQAPEGGHSTAALVGEEGQEGVKPADKWNNAIRMTQMQLQVIKAFKPPHGHPSPVLSPRRPPPPGRSDTMRSAELWQRARTVRSTIGVVNAFRGGRRRNDPVVTLQMLDAGTARDHARPGSRASMRTNGSYR
ncbi:uncharacterized protein EV422DRAFT_176948 [Fimicolochytrium jonesii]|uniref:uncharacterized protein n=1 Tax=Fimicolochytrium jonesii TaxID=1396493 RepID=UPI0022FE68C8|nr:uncharacterized protein EV422DRAFT_176948 [Fimicolochytrium jonesii]KAI8818278.1 hypothetical protein EV422DRAFT_176948 [Fimicolochytrium jonesii]